MGAFERRIATALSNLSARGTTLYFLHGNRDFLLGPEFCRAAGMQLLEQPHRIDLAGQPAVLLHGDSLCLLDRQYQRYRRKVSDPEWQRRMLARPRWLRRGVAAGLRAISRLRNRNGPRPYTDVADDAVIGLFETSGVRRIVHGHTHRPDRHEYEIAGRPCERIVLGDWYDQGSVLEAGENGLELCALPRD